MAAEFRSPGWPRALAASLIAPTVAGIAFFPPFLIFPPFALMAIVVGYAIALIPALLAGIFQDRMTERRPQWRRAGRWYLVGAAIGMAMFGIYLPTPTANAMNVPVDWKSVALLWIACGSAGGAVAVARYWLAYRLRLGRQR